MDFSPVKLFIFVLVFVPGYIFVQTLDIHLLKGEKSQFEKTVQVLLTSTVIWVVVYIIPIQYISSMRNIIIDYIFGNNDMPENYDKQFIIKISIKIYIITMVAVFLFANIYGIVRKIPCVNKLFITITGRDWYISVSMRFFRENLGKRLVVTCKDGKKYIGILRGAPDNINDKAIMLYNPYLRENNQLVALTDESMLLYLNNVSRCEVL